jgi:ABC-type lipoprotein release transport system permease subunit
VYKLFLAIRYVTRRPIMLLGMIGVTLGLWALTVVPGVFSGYINELGQHLRAASGDITFVTVTSTDRPISFERVDSLVQNDPAVLAVAPRIVWYGALLPERAQLPIEQRPPIRTPEEAERSRPKFYQLIGIDWERESQVTSLGKWIHRVKDAERRVEPGEANPMLAREVNGERTPALLLGQAAAEAEALTRDDLVRLTSGRQQMGSEFTPIDQAFVIAGTFSPGFYGYEKATAFVDIQVLRQLLSAGAANNTQVFSEAAILLKPGSDIARVRSRLETYLRENLDSTRFAILSWKGKNERYLQFIEQQRGLFRLVLFVLIVVAVLLIFVTLLMMVSEKVRDIGTVAALGGTRRGVATIFVLCALMISISGSMLGGFLGWLTCRNLDNVNSLAKSWLDIELFPKQIYGLEHVPYEFDLGSAAIYSASAIALSVLFALWPAWRAASYDPVKALRYD